MLTLLIGHRGVGKSTLACKLASLLSDWEIADLDQLVSEDAGKSIPEIFHEGEETFRAKELQSFQRHVEPLIESAKSHLVSLGGGFPNDYLDQLKSNHPQLRIVWLRRASDKQARHEGERPQLKQDIVETWNLRKQGYQTACDEVLFLPEGPFWPESYCEFLKNFFKQEILVDELQIFQTLPPGTADELTRKAGFQFSKGFGVELRTDLHSEASIFDFVAHMSASDPKLLISLRTPPSKVFLQQISELGTDRNGQIVIDCDLKIWKQSPALTLSTSCTLSLHSENSAENQLKELEEAALVLKEHSSYFNHLKWAPWVGSVTHLKDLWNAYKSLKANNIKVTFLPRGPHGFGKFLRLLNMDNNPFNFCHSFLHDDASQPSLWEIQSRVKSTKWRAVLGSDTTLSWSPLFHQHWSKEDGENFLNLSVSDPMDKNEIEFLQELGLQGLAITSPFKHWAASNSPKSFANTWSLNTGGDFAADNTDIEALKELLPTNIAQQSVLIFGQGAIGKQLQELIPHAKCLSSRSLSSGSDKILENFDLVLWAASPTAEFNGLPRQVGTVWDMNYFEHSQARVYAQLAGAEYVSGREFFETQGRLQQAIWSNET